LYDDYVEVGSGTFEIEDTAVTPGNLVLFEDIDFLAFDATIDTTVDDPRTYTLGIDDFPPSPNPLNQLTQGILFDDSAQPLRFDTPTTVTGNGAGICDENDCAQRVGIVARLTLLDSNTFDLGYISNGTIDDIDTLMQNYPGEPIFRLGGFWTHVVGIEIGGASQQVQGLYELSTLPSPCLGDFKPDGDVDGVDLDTQAQGGTGISLSDFSQHFGRNDCPIL
jgi:hypothetical protein